MDIFKFGIGDLGKKNLDFKRYRGAWDGKKECDLISMALMWIKHNHVLYSNIPRKNTNDTYVMQIEKLRKNTPIKI